MDLESSELGSEGSSSSGGGSDEGGLDGSSLSKELRSELSELGFSSLVVSSSGVLEVSFKLSMSLSPSSLP